MKNLLYILLLVLILGMAGVVVKVNCDLEDYMSQIAIERYENEKRLEQMEKDIRILKTDSYINEYGFEGGSND